MVAVVSVLLLRSFGQVIDVFGVDLFCVPVGLLRRSLLALTRRCFSTITIDVDVAAAVGVNKLEGNKDKIKTGCIVTALEPVTLIKR